MVKFAIAPLILLSAATVAHAFVPTNYVATRRSSATTARNAVDIVEDAAARTSIDQERRNLMNYILLTSTALTVSGLAFPYLSFFVPPVPTQSGDGTIPAKDALGHDIVASSYLSSHPPGDRSLVQGLHGDATYLIVKDNGGDGSDAGTLQDFALNAICTHLGCVVPWSEAANKFICPCHGSQYNVDGGVVRGPAPLPLALAHVSVNEKNVVTLRPWTELDFRTDEKPWWN